MRSALLALARLATLLLPLLLLHARAGAELSIGVIDAGFLLESALGSGWAWLRRPWFLAGLPWWIWLVVCSAAGQGGTHALLEALAAGRFLVLIVALSDWVLRQPADQKRLHLVIVLAAAWIGVECWQQYLTGRNLFGEPRWGDGALTGPFAHPRAGPALLLLLFPAMLPAIAGLLERPGLPSRLAGAALAVLGVATMLLIGQRMPALLMLLGLLVSALLVQRLRPTLVGALLAGAGLLAATPLVSPPTFRKLIVHFAEQMRHFSSSAYGLLYIRAAVMTAAHPLLGQGFEGFRRGCADPRYFRGLRWLGIRDLANGGIGGCNLHPHNFYLEAATEGGLPELACFVLMVVVWLGILGRGLGSRPPPIRVALFATALVALWPFASTSAFLSVPNAGWLFLMLGWGFAASGTGGTRTGPRRAPR